MGGGGHIFLRSFANAVSSFALLFVQSPSSYFRSGLNKSLLSVDFEGDISIEAVKEKLRKHLYNSFSSGSLRASWCIQAGEFNSPNLN